MTDNPGPSPVNQGRGLNNKSQADWERFKVEVIDRLARIETKLDSLPCKSHQNRLEKLEANQAKYMALTVAIVIVLSMIFSRLPWPFG
ncbi:MAG: hypothetical protein JRD89_00535 [Deltaproteobacteria bacterium]|nr:hypothetical protein [Deltaproteobacteria bacterium]